MSGNNPAGFILTANEIPPIFENLKAGKKQTVAPPAAQPPGSLSVLDFGATFINNTAVAPYWANSLRVAGGREVVVRGNLLTDPGANSGMHIGVFGESGHPIVFALVENNVIRRALAAALSRPHYPWEAGESSHSTSLRDLAIVPLNDEETCAPTKIAEMDGRKCG